MYAALDHVAIRMGEEVLRRGPEGEGAPLNTEVTPVTANAWTMTWWIILGAGLVGVTPIAIGALLLRLRGRGLDHRPVLPWPRFGGAALWVGQGCFDVRPRGLRRMAGPGWR
ncbi:hypothetical protein GCM10022252_34750 [Streptosporangium oxazolinicum]|uniref:Uncharacterized protein n=1 Tax=Streptosporangium oxazolinicum TaxID=909287 RepID=A0ABP8AXA7_9ACTN